MNKSYLNFIHTGHIVPQTEVYFKNNFPILICFIYSYDIVSGKEKSTGKSSVSSTMPSASIKKNSITMYNHATRDTRAISCGDDRFVVTNLQTDEDAYSQAAKEASSIDATDKEHQNRLQEMRHKIAMTKKSVEKEYNDTISFLNSLPKGNKPIVRTI